MVCGIKTKNFQGVNRIFLYQSEHLLKSLTKRYQMSFGTLFEYANSSINYYFIQLSTTINCLNITYKFSNKLE